MIFLSFVIYSILARRGKVHSDFDQSDARDKNENETRKYFRLDYQETDRNFEILKQKSFEKS